jgi:branched-chain amino acid transport system substrate-binding protein
MLTARTLMGSRVQAGLAATLLLLWSSGCTSAPAASPTSAPAKPTEAAKPAAAGSPSPAGSPAAAGSPSAAASPAAKPAESAPAAKPATGPAIKIGVLHSTTGPFLFEGVGGNEGLKLYWDAENNQVAGRPVQFIFEDTEGNPNNALTKVRKLVEQDQVNLLVGPIGSNEALAIRDYVHANKVPMVLGYSIAKDLTQDKASPYIFRVTGSLQWGAAGGWYAAAKLNYKRALSVSADYAAGRDAAEMFKSYFEAAGGKIVNEIFVPLGATDVAPYITQLRSEMSGADVVVLPQIVGGTASQFVKAYDQFGLKAQIPLFSGAVTLDEASTLPPAGDSALDLVSYGEWAQTLDTPENKRFVESFQAKFQKDPGQHNLFGYMEGRVIGEALKAVGGNAEDKDKVAEAMRKVTFDSPKGLFKMDEKQQAIVTIFIRKVTNQGGTLRNVVIDQIPNVDQFWKAPS